MENFMNKGLFDPEALKRVNEMRKTWKIAYPTKEGITKFFEEVRKGIEEDKDGYWAKLKENK